MTDKEVLYTSVFWWSLCAFGILSIIAGGVLTLIGFAKEKILGAFAAAFVLLVVVVGSPIVAYTLANSASGPDWEQAIDDKATYLEKLHGVWVHYNVVHHECSYRDSDININTTGCEYVTVESYCDSYDEEGDCDDTDYKFKPWFHYEETLTGELNVFKRGHVVFASHLAPENWRAARWHLPFFATPGKSFKFERHVEWVRVKQAIDQGVLLPGSVWNPYFHWIYADEYTILKEYSPHIPFYRDAGLLPQMNMIRDSAGNVITADIRGNTSGVGYDYDVVQFLAMQVGPQAHDEWQKTAHLWTAMAGPQIESSLMLFFAPAAHIENRQQWIKTAKAWLMSEADEEGRGFGRYILPKNVVLIGCGVSSDARRVEWCEAETGLFLGNEQFLMDIHRLSPFPFTPTAAFGAHMGQFVSEGSVLRMENPDWDDRDIEMRVVQLDFSGGSLDAVIRDQRAGHGFHRIEMSSFKEKRATLQLSQEEIGAIKRANILKALLGAIALWGLVFIGVFGAARRTR